MIRLASENDIFKIMDLLRQVDLVHHNGRPDIFKIGTKYSEEELKELLKDKTRPILKLLIFRTGHFSIYKIYVSLLLLSLVLTKSNHLLLYLD